MTTATATPPTHALSGIPTAYGHSEELPFIVLAGARGLGKSTALRELRAAYRSRTPVALIDGEETRFDRPPPGRPPETWSPVYEALSAVAEQLGEPVAGAGRISFPRLACGLLAVAAGGWGDRGLPRICAEAERILLLSDTGGWLAGRWVGKAVARLVSSLSAQGRPAVEAIIEAALEAFSEGMSSSHRRLRRGAVWYRDHPHAAGSPKRGLVLLSRHFRAGGDARTHAEHHLVRALLADLDDAYAGVVPRPQRAGRPVILLDNVQEAAGRRLLESVLRDRADGRADQVAFFAGLRGQGHPALRHAARRTLPEATGSGGWTPGVTPSSHALLIPMPALSPENTLHVIGAACAGVPVPPRLPYATHRLTGGSPLGTALIAESARQNLPRGVTTLTGLLSAAMVVHDEDEDHGERPTYRVLLDRLLPNERHLDALAVLAAAHDRDSALALAGSRLPDGFDESAVLALEDRLAREGHAPTPGHFVGDPFLRTLLLLGLRDRDPDHKRSRSVHRTLADHYGPARAAHRAHHELALGNADLAVAHLCDTFHGTDLRTWLTSLAFIASAPHDDGPNGDGPDDRGAVALGRPDPALHARVRRVLHAVWQLTDPLVLPDPEVAERLGRELEQLSAGRPAADVLLRRASRDWPDDALAGRPLRVG
ncbi:hypothetical protein F3K40_20270 [Streptomyces sp. LBUM 1478]|uniref:hypothetical protein n=8 Tax=Streptomyces TaxID=1883 RepID=UPI0002E021C6|nr:MULTISPECIES: hypothetical protein [Streptomyces]MBP5907595.1 hypothetical protein [Streptomyces sp. LBUM 1478]MBP5891730.1 hypothetical protein [Streptomyces sp. LBUM 1481]MBP5921889.1 hypothetical protein [Streptomyces sp. LBUM 1483]MDX2577363.1 hypothetical protein [Streptomyces scabiei]MDX2657152.1 hypothetical protein [Streptomyces scabiei]